MGEPTEGLGSRERQIMEILYRRGAVIPADVRNALPDPLSDSTVRTMLRHLEKKKLVGRKLRQGRFVYYPLRPAEQIRGSAVQHVLDTFFGGSASELVTALLQTSRHRLTDDELTRLQRVVEEAKEGRV